MLANVSFADAEGNVVIKKIEFEASPFVGQGIVLQGFGFLRVVDVIHLPNEDEAETKSVVPFLFCSIEEDQSIVENWKVMLQ